MNAIKVIIIIPVYNVANYLERCIDSCVNQTLEDVEIILVNDCSPDPRDSEIMRKYAELYPEKIMCIWHDRNLKLGEARNSGIRASKGKFVYCLDSDDFIEPSLCERMYWALISSDADLAICDTNRIESDKSISNWESNGDFAADDLSERLMSLKMHAAWLMMIRKSVIIENGLFFPATIGFEDVQCILWVLAANKIARVHESLHNYVIRDNSLMQVHKLETYQWSVKTVNILYMSTSYRKLSDELKQLIFLYMMRFVIGWILSVSKYYPSEIKTYCQMLLKLEDLSGIRIDTIKHDSEHKEYVVSIFCFMKQNIDSVNLYSELPEYIETQHRVYYHKMRLKALDALGGKRITIWGAGKRGIGYANILIEAGVPFEITDGNEKLHGTKLTNSCMVKSWNEVKETTDIVLVSVANHFEEIYEMIMKESCNIDVKDFRDLVIWKL